MAPPTANVRVEQLLEHSAWIRALAAQLVRDPTLADDLVQRTMLAAVEHPSSAPRDGGPPLRRWLAAVLRNFARQERRREDRRSMHEERAARPEALPSTTDVLERAAAQRELVEAVLALDEPYRTTILLRFFDGLPPRAVARRMSVPVETVRTRIARGIARLRERLDREHDGDRAAWLVAFLPLVPRPAPLSPAVLGAVVMNAKILVPAVALAVVGALAVWFVSHPSAEPGAALAAASGAAPESKAAPESAPAVGPLSTEPSGPAKDSARVAASTPASPAPSAPTAVAPMLRGRVLDERGAPTSGVRVALDSEKEKPTASAGHSDASATSGADGAFEFPFPRRGGRVVCIDPRFATVLAGVCPLEPSGSPSVVVIAPRVQVAGRVLAEEGYPLAAARVAIEVPDEVRMRFREVLDRSEGRSWTATTDAQGAFALEDAPRIDGARLRASHDGYLPFDESLLEHLGTGLAITLSRPRVEDGLLRGKVVDPAGAPVGGARVAFGLDLARTEDDGAFAFKLEDPKSVSAQLNVPPTALVAVKKGFLPAKYEPTTTDGKPSWPAMVVLRLGADALAISGRVVDHKGRGMGGTSVWIVDTTLLGASERGMAHVENVIAGEGDKNWRQIEADGEGRFRVDGLLARDYRLRAMDPKTLLLGEAGPFAAGTTDAEIRLRTDELFPRVAGRVLSHAGKPVAGASIFPMCDAFQVRLKGQIVGTSHSALDGTKTDEDGRFEMKDVPKSLVYLRVEGEDLLPLEYGRYVEGDERFAETAVKCLPKDKIADLAIVVDLRCHVQIELADRTSADGLAILDERGKPLTISIFVGNGRREGPRAQIEDGRSFPMAVSDAGRTVVLYKGELEVSRKSLELMPGELKQIRL